MPTKQQTRRRTSSSRYSLLLILLVVVVVAAPYSSHAFQHPHQRHSTSTSTSTSHVSSSLAPSPLDTTNNELITNDYWIPREELAAQTSLVLSLGGEKQKLINAYGVWCAIVSLVTCPLWMLAMTVVDWYGKQQDEDWDPTRALYDKTGKVWSKAWLTMTNSFPTVSGTLYREGPCLYVANHASWLDIAVLCTVLDPVFKFIAKGDLMKLPGIGQQLVGGKHILIDREDRRSQLKTFKTGIQWLKQGVPLMAFPEGTRSPTGRLGDLKGGLFAMATKTGVPIVPITLHHTHSIFPPYALLPIQAGHNKLHVHIHDPIDSQGKTDEELGQLVRQAFLSTLPLCQRPLETENNNDMIATTEIPENKTVMLANDSTSNSV